MNCRVRFGNCFLIAPQMYQPCCLVPGCHSKLGELRKKQLTKPQKQFILSLGSAETSLRSNFFSMCSCAIIYTFKKIFLSATTHVDGLLALLPALREGVGDLPDGPEEVLARERPQLLDLLGPLGDGE